MCFLFFVCFLSPLVWFFLWLPEEVLTLLFLLHRENGDFSILMKDIIVQILVGFSIVVSAGVVPLYISDVNLCC